MSQNFITDLIAKKHQQMIADAKALGQPPPTSAQVRTAANIILAQDKDKSVGNFVLRNYVEPLGQTVWYIEDLMRPFLEGPPPSVVVSNSFTIPRVLLTLSTQVPSSSKTLTIPKNSSTLSTTPPVVNSTGVFVITSPKGSLVTSLTAPSRIISGNFLVPPKGNLVLLSSGLTTLRVPLAGTIAMQVGGATVSPTTLDPTQKGPNHVLANGNLTVTDPSTTASDNTRAIASASTGKYYFEFTANTVNNDAIGYVNATETRTSTVGGSANSIGANFVGQWVYNGSNLATNGVNFVNGHVYGMAVDIDAKLAWVKDITAASNWNASGTANPATGVGGASFAGLTGAIYPCMGVYWPGGQYTCNFGVTTYAATPPAGFGNWTMSTTKSYAPTVRVGTPATLIWSDEFDGPTLDAITGGGGNPTAAWRYNAVWQGDHGYRDFAGTNWNINPDDPNYAGFNPFLISNSVLTIQSFRTPPALTSFIRADLDSQGNQALAVPAWCGGLLVTNSAARRFIRPCYIEWRAQWPNPGKGMFPALWLYCSDGAGDALNKGKAEIDFLEIFGVGDGQTWNTGFHMIANDGSGASVALGTQVSDTAGWHTYGLDWTATYMRFYRDNVLLYEDTINAPWFEVYMDILMNFSMDASWFPVGNQSDGTTPSPMSMSIDYVRVYTSKPP